MTDTPPPDPPEPKATVPEWLTSFLDGEIQPEEQSRAREAITRSPQLKQEAESLQKAWDLLDFLPITEAAEEKTRATLEIVMREAGGEPPGADSPEGGTEEKAASLSMGAQTRSTSGVFTPGRGGRTLALAVGWILAGTALGLSFQFASFQVASQRVEKVQQIQGVVENLSLLRDAQDLEFLRALEQSGLFERASTGEVP